MPASKAARLVAAKKVDHRGRVFTHIPAQMASAGPPLGSQLGAIGVNIAAFVKDFNLKTSIYLEGVPVPSYVTVNPDRSYNLKMMHPPFPWLVKQAAGIQRGAMHAWQGEVAGKITRKHVYEIARMKSEDERWQMVDMQEICRRVIDEAHDCGVHVVDDLTPESYAEFLQERADIVEEQKAELQTKREAKLLRTVA